MPRRAKAARIRAGQALVVDDSEAVGLDADCRGKRRFSGERSETWAKTPLKVTRVDTTPRTPVGRR